MSAYREMFHSPPTSSLKSDLIAWVALSTATDDAAIKAVRMARAKAKLSQIAPYQKALANLMAATRAIQPTGEDHDRTRP